MTDPIRDERMVEWLLGELPATEAKAMQRATAADAGLAQDEAELRCLLDDLRTVTVEPTSRVSVAVRHAVERRARLRQGAGRGLRPVERAVLGLRVAAVAAVALGALMFGRSLWHEFGRADTGPDAAWMALPTPRVAPVVAQVAPGVERSPAALALPRYWLDDASMRSFYKGLTRATAAPSEAWLIATNDLASLRLEFQSRYNPHLRREAIRAAGGSDYLESRIQSLAVEVAAKIDASLTRGSPSVADVSLALRALMAGGSTKRLGPHHQLVRRCSDYLSQRIASLHGGELASALAGLMDAAVVSPRSAARLVGEHTARMTAALLDDKDGEERPGLLQWHTPAMQVADAGRVLRLAPAFGVDSRDTARARGYLAAYLAKRVAFRTRYECPDLWAALLYGFDGLVERTAVERKLRLWHARDLVPDYYVALHHIAWSQFPLRAGWADFQRQLRAVAASSTPASVADAAALLLSLAVNYAAPGCQELLAIAAR